MAIISHLKAKCLLFKSITLHRALSVSCAIQQVVISYLFYAYISGVCTRQPQPHGTPRFPP